MPDADVLPLFQDPAPKPREPVEVERPSDVLPPIRMLIGPVTVDTETSGLFTDDGARVCAVSVAYRVDHSHIWYHAFPFDQGRAEDKGFAVVRYADTDLQRKRGLAGLPKGDPHGRWDWDTDYNLERGEWERLLTWLRNAGAAVGLVGQNVGFDTHHLRVGTRHWSGLDLDEYVRWDTMLASAEMWPTEATGLKPTAERLWGPERVEEAALLREALVETKKRYGLVAADGPRYDLVPWEVNGPYAASDAVLTHELAEEQMLRFDEGEAHYPRYRRSMGMRRVIHAMERRGLGPYDVKRSRRIASALEARAAELAPSFPFNPAKAAEAREYFFVQLGAKPWGPGETPHGTLDAKTGKPKQGTLSTDVARRMAGDVPHARDYAEYLSITSAARMWYRGYADLAGEDGRLRTSYRQAHVKSGRMSVERWQAQALPKSVDLREFTESDPHGRTVPPPKALFLPRAEGWGRYNVDLSQAELRIAAKFANCQPMIELLEGGGDVHGDAATRIFGVTPEDPDWKIKRDIAKRTVFGGLFAIGPRTFRETLFHLAGLDMTEQECGRIIYAFRDAYPEFTEAYQYWLEHADMHGYVDLVDGARTWLVRGRDWPRTGWNRRVQGSLAVFVRDWLPLVESMTAEYDALVNTVHDSVVLELPEDVAPDLLSRIEDATAELWYEMFGIKGGAEAEKW